MQKSDIRSVFFGTPELAVTVLDELKAAGIVPTVIVTAPDKPAGRGLMLTPPPVKVWADEHNIDVLQPQTLKDPEIEEFLSNTDWDVFFVAAYGKIIPKQILELPKHGTLNVHPSLLPQFRGASPIKSAILEDAQETGVTIMLLDEELDHGPIIAQARIAFDEEDLPAGKAGWPPKGSELEDLLAHEGGKLLAETTLPWINGEIKAEEQNHDEATFCKKITKEDGLINVDDDPYQNYLKIRAFDDWPGTYFFAEKNNKKLRVKVVDAEFEDGNLTITRVIPEGKKEMDYADFMRG